MIRDVTDYNKNAIQVHLREERTDSPEIAIGFVDGNLTIVK